MAGLARVDMGTSWSSDICYFLLCPGPMGGMGRRESKYRVPPQVTHSLPGVSYKKNVVRAMAEGASRDQGAEGW